MFEADCVYHIYNHANGFENLFKEEKNYDYFLQRYMEFAGPIVETYAYCLMPNHFHMMVKVRSEEKVAYNLGSKTSQKFETFGKIISRQFGSLCSAYTQAFNKVYDRRGSLFQPNMKKKQVTNDDYFTRLVLYIHNNPVKHGFVKDPYEWPHSSIHQIAGLQLSKSPKVLGSSEKAAVIDWFGGVEELKNAHVEIGDIRSVFE